MPTQSPGSSGNSGSRWRVLGALTLLAVFFHVVMEWLFFVTKPSFLSVLSVGEKLWLPGSASLPLMAAALLPVLLLSLPAWISPDGRVNKICWLIGRGVPALIVAASLLLLLDNFIHTVLGWGSPSLEGKARILPAIVYFALAIAAYRWLGRWDAALTQNHRKRRVLYAAAAVVILCTAGASLAQQEVTRNRAGDAPALANSGGRPPNILLIGSDGVNAEHMSLYGYRRATTPFLDRLARESLVCDNAFPNAAATGASVISILTSRLPTETGVIYPPDIVRGASAYLHFPVLLKRQGYRTAQFTVRWYADALDMNLQGAFDWANSRAATPLEADLVTGRLGQTSTYFLTLMRERLTDRLLFTAERRDRPDPFQEVTENRLPIYRDQQRLSALFSFIEASEEPFFAHVHLMGTHGPRFVPRQPVFSSGQEQTQDWMVDFYDDAILEFDESMNEVVRFLQQRDLFEETIVVVYSDHGQRYTTLQRVPLLFHFPGGAHAGRITVGVQGLDIAPTLLDAIGTKVPEWMEGASLLRSGIDPCRKILSVTFNNDSATQRNNWWFSVPKAPFYTLGWVSVSVGRHAYTLNPTSRQLTQASIATAAGAGSGCPVPDPGQVRVLLIDHLRANGYDVSSLDAGARGLESE